MARVRSRAERGSLKRDQRGFNRGRSGPVGSFLAEPAPGRAKAVAALRLVFAGMFLAQVLIAALVAVAFLTLSDTGLIGRPSALGAVLVALSPLQILLGIAIPSGMAAGGSRQSSLSAMLLAGVLLATPGWFFVLALVTGQGTPYLIALAAACALGYSLGFLLAGRLGSRASAQPDSGQNR